MKFWKEIKKGLLIASMAIALTGIVGSTSSKASTAADRNSEITTLNLNTQRETPKYYIVKGKTKKFSLKNNDGLDLSARGIWTSSNTKVATVNRKGLVKARTKGKTVISATLNGVTYNSLVVVQTPKLSKTTLTITEGKSRQLRLKGNGQKVTWYSKNAAIATVDENGKVTAVSEGKVKIVAQIRDTRYKKSYGCWVTVKPDPNAEKEPETEVPENNSIADNYAALKKYISTYGGLNKAKNRCIFSNKVGSDNYTYSTTIVYEQQTDRLNFLLLAVSPSKKILYTLNTYIDCTSSNYIAPEIIKGYDNNTDDTVDSIAFYYKTNIYVPTYTKNQKVTFTKYPIEGSTYNDASAQNESSIMLANAFYSWEELLNEKVNLSLKDLGFTSLNYQ